MKEIIYSAFAFIFCVKSSAKNPSDLELLFLRNHITAGFAIPFLIMHQEEHIGMGQLNLRTLPGFAVKVEYSYNFNSYLGITSGSKLGVQVFGYDVNARADDFDLAEDAGRKYFHMIPFFSIPLTFTPRIFISKRSLLQADLGASVIFFVPDNSISTLSIKNGVDTENIFKMTTRFADSPQFTFHTGISYGLVLKNHNILKTGLAYNFGRRNVIDGNYTFRKDDVIVGNGKISSSFNYFALELSYVFTRVSSLSKD